MTLIRIFFFLLFFSFSLFASSPTSLETKKLSVSFSIPAKSFTGTHEFHILNGVDVAGYYWKTSNDPEDVPDWSSERYNYRKTGNNTGNLTIINSSSEPTLLELSFSSSTTASCNLSFWSVMNGELVKESYTGTATVTLTDLVLSDVPIEYQVAEPSGYYAPASIAGGTLSAQDRYWSIYDESINFATDGSFSASITNDSGNLSASGSSYMFTKTGTNSATLSYTIDGAGYVFEYDFQFTGENAGIYSKYADYGGGNTDVTTGPFSLSGVAVPQQFAWEDYDDFSSANINTSKWSTGHWDGGNLPIISASKIAFSGNTISGFKDVLPTAGMLGFNAGIKPLLEESFATSNGSQSHSYLELLNDEDILGIEVEVQLPADASTSTGVGLYASDWSKAFSEDQSEKSFFGLDLRSDHIDVEYVDPNTGSFVSSSISTELGRSHIFAFIFEDQNVLLFVDGAKVAEFSSAIFSRDSILIRAMNGAGESFSAYAQNIRVIRNWEDYDDFSSSSLDTSKWEIGYWDGAQAPNVENGKAHLYGTGVGVGSIVPPSFDELVGMPQNGTNNSFLFLKDDLISGVEAEISLDSTFSGIYLGIMEAVEGGSAYAGIELNSWKQSGPSLEFSNTVYENGTETLESTLGDKPANLGQSYKVTVVKGVSAYQLFLNSELIGEYPVRGELLYFVFGGYHDEDLPWDGYIDNVRVLRRSTTTTQPDHVTVVSDPNGQAVVVQVGNEYQWNSTLDGITLWSVSESERDGKWSALTAKFSGGNLLYGFEFKDDVAETGNNKVTYQIDENGYIKSLENDGGYQYYHVISVKNGIIATLEGDEQGVVDDGVSVADQWFFTTRAAAEEYYYSKVNPKDWMWFDHYPWVYSNEMKEWLYFVPSGGKLMYYSNNNKSWREFSQ